MKKRLLLALYDRSGLGAYMPVDYKGHELAVEEHWEKFAELIVRECMNTIAESREARQTSYYYRNRVAEHFGVEE